MSRRKNPPMRFIALDYLGASDAILDLQDGMIAMAHPEDPVSYETERLPNGNTRNTVSFTAGMLELPVFGGIGHFQNTIIPTQAGVHFEFITYESDDDQSQVKFKLFPDPDLLHWTHYRDKRIQDYIRAVDDKLCNYHELKRVQDRISYTTMTL